MIEVKVNFLSNGRLCVNAEHFMTPCVPRMGEFYCVQYWSCPIYRVEWNRAQAYIYVDVSEIPLNWETHE
jgi:hypothetical protein